MRPANLILGSSKNYISDEQGLIDIYVGERETGVHKALTSGSNLALDLSTLVTAAALAPPSAVAVPSTILVGGTISGDEIDAYGINLVAGQTYLFSARGDGATPLADTFLYVADGAFNILDYDDDGGDGVNSLITYTATYTGTHYIAVGAYPDSGETGTYTLDAIASPGVDVVSDEFASAVVLTANTTTFGFIDGGAGPYGADFSEVDTYAITVEAGKLYTIEMAGGADYESDPFALFPGELDPRLVLYDAAGNPLLQNDDISFPGDISAGIGFVANVSGTYYLDAFSWAPWTGGYSITFKEVDLADLDPLDSINWFSADNVPFDSTNTAYVYFGDSDENFGQTADDGGPMVTIDWNDYEKQQVMEALEQYEKILGVNYEITSDSSAATFRLLKTESEDYGAYFFPQDEAAYGDDQGIGVFNVLSGGWTFDQQQSL